jgi:hypothetical protein
MGWTAWHSAKIVQSRQHHPLKFGNFDGLHARSRTRREFFAPALRQGDIVVMDNWPATKSKASRKQSSPPARHCVICQSIIPSYQIAGRILRTGAANFSTSGEKRQDNDFVIVESAQAAAAFKHNFDARFSSGEALSIGARQ